MNYLRITIALLFIFSLQCINAQPAQRTMTFDDLVGWKRITEQAISDDGKWIACKMEPWKGDATLQIFNAKGEEIALFECADKVSFTLSSQYLLTTIKPKLQDIESLRLKKAKEDEMPVDQLLIFHLADKKQERIDSIRSWKLSENADYIAYQRGNKKDSILYIRELNNSKTISFPAVTEFEFAKEGNVIYYISNGDSLDFKSGLYTYVPETATNHMIYQETGDFKNATFNKEGNRLAFLHATQKDSTNYSLHVSANNKTPQLVITKELAAQSPNWIISEYGQIRFSDNSERLFFGIAPEPNKKDTTILEENRPHVEIWNWDEKIQYTQQKYNKEKDLKKTYQTVFNFNSNKIIQLEFPDLPNHLTANEGNAHTGILTTSEPYDLERMWTGRSQYDAYTIDLETGSKESIKKALAGQIKLSPKGDYAFWYCWKDSSWYTYSIPDKKEYRLTTPDTFIAWDEDNDIPDYPETHGIAGWTKDDKYILLYDRYDIWQFDPKKEKLPVNLTQNGREKKISYRYIQTDKEEKFIDINKWHLISGFNEQTKGYGYYTTRFTAPVFPKALLSGNYKLNTPLKSKKSNIILYTMETFEQYPDIYLSDINFKKSLRLTYGDEQQKEILWGTAELTSWKSYDGSSLQGVVYKPANFDPAKKYPLIVNFYERNSETLYSYRMPEPHRSTIDYHFYNSNGYIVFNPDITYKTGYPGESCYNSVMPGIASLIEKGYIDEKAIAAQGHSWGGYQVAYLATRTNLFAAIESGAPVVNMFSAYGGIRWGSGLNRSFQYEHTQSRIGASIWETPQLYTENSPLFTMDKVETPILIMHNDNDGHVPWHLGVEYFIALKRLQKPVWLLNYPGEIHWPMKLANRIDFQKRMFQFFNHYLINEPMPKWMREGVKAIDQDFELGY